MTQEAVNPNATNQVQITQDPPKSNLEELNEKVEALKKEIYRLQDKYEAMVAKEHKAVTLASNKIKRAHENINLLSHELNEKISEKQTEIYRLQNERQNGSF